MTETVVSPLPRWVLDTFEGKLLEHWLGYREHGDGLIVFDGDTENEDNEDIILLEMSDAEVSALADLAEEAGNSLGKSVAALLRDPVGTEIMNEHYGKIDISAIRYYAEIVENGQSMMMDPEHLLQSLASRFPSEIPYVEASWNQGGTFVTAESVDFLETKAELDARRERYFATLPESAPRA